MRPTLLIASENIVLMKCMEFQAAFQLFEDMFFSNNYVGLVERLHYSVVDVAKFMQPT